MTTNILIPSLIFMTLAAGVGFALIQMVSFLQRRENREVAEDTLIGHGTTARGTPSGALPELAAIGGVAIVAMALLTFGHNAQVQSAENLAQTQSTADSPRPGADAAATDRMTDPPRVRANPVEMSAPPTSATSPGPGTAVPIPPPGAPTTKEPPQ